jgi:ribosomal protein S1
MEEVGPWPERPGDDDWRAAAAALSKDERVFGVVLSHRHFGFFVTLRDYPGVPGLVEITSYRPDGEVPRYDANAVLDPPFLAIGSMVEAEVLGLRERERQIGLRYVGLLALR